MTNPIAKAVHCPTCGAPPRRACRSLDPSKNRIVSTHSARKKLFFQMPDAMIRSTTAWSTIHVIARCEDCDWRDWEHEDYRKAEAAAEQHAKSGHTVVVERGQVKTYNDGDC